MGRLNAEQKQFFKDNGYLLLKNVLSDEVLSEVISAYENLFKRKNEETIENSLNGTRKKKALRIKGIENLEHHHAVFTKFATNDDILDALEDIMETENIILHHSKAFLEPPGEGADYPMHQDYHQCPYENDSMVTLFLHLDAANADSGGLLVYPGSHKLGLQDVEQVNNSPCVDQKQFPLEKGTPVIAERGDMIIFSYFLIHGSLLNQTDRPRRVFIAQYAAASDKPKGTQENNVVSGLMVRGARFQSSDQKA